MRSTQTAWFWFNGAYSWEKGAMMTARPTHYAPVLNGKKKEVSGRDGEVFVTDGTYIHLRTSPSGTIRRACFCASAKGPVRAVSVWPVPACVS